MRKINKQCDLSTEYKSWEEELEQTGVSHPKYNSSNGKYYWDIVMQLFRCQDGLCAYTEEELCDEALFKSNQWEEGKYNGTPPKEGRLGQLEHFDESLKSKNSETVGRKDWLWDNLFMVYSDINIRKGTTAIDVILKPDRDGYNPFELLEYDPELHVFIPNSELDEETSIRVKEMICILGINQVHFIRKKFLRNHFRRARLEPFPVRNNLPHKFPTSFEMCINLIEKEELSLEDLAS